MCPNPEATSNWDPIQPGSLVRIVSEAYLEVKLYVTNPLPPSSPLSPPPIHQHNRCVVTRVSDGASNRLIYCFHAQILIVYLSRRFTRHSSLVALSNTYHMTLSADTTTHMMFVQVAHFLHQFWRLQIRKWETNHDYTPDKDTPILYTRPYYRHTHIIDTPILYTRPYYIHAHIIDTPMLYTRPYSRHTHIIDTPIL